VRQTARPPDSSSRSTGAGGFGQGSNVDSLIGGDGADTFRFGEAFGGGVSEMLGADTITDFGDGADTVDPFTGPAVRMGLGTTTVTIWDGISNFGTITASNGHLWVAGDFS
jgi:Ca2+-binding RTX toxin-like protein